MVSYRAGRPAADGVERAYRMVLRGMPAEQAWRKCGKPTSIQRRCAAPVQSGKQRRPHSSSREAPSRPTRASRRRDLVGSQRPLNQLHGQASLRACERPAVSAFRAAHPTARWGQASKPGGGGSSSRCWKAKAPLRPTPATCRRCALPLLAHPLHIPCTPCPRRRHADLIPRCSPFDTPCPCAQDFDRLGILLIDEAMCMLDAWACMPGGVSARSCRAAFSAARRVAGTVCVIFGRARVQNSGPHFAPRT